MVGKIVPVIHVIKKQTQKEIEMGRGQRIRWRDSCIESPIIYNAQLLRQLKHDHWLLHIGNDQWKSSTKASVQFINLVLIEWIKW